MYQSEAKRYGAANGDRRQLVTVPAHIFAGQLVTVKISGE